MTSEAMEEGVTFEELGAELKKARLAKKWRLRDISRRTRIQIDYVKNLEEGNFNFMPEPVIRGFIKSYSRDTELDQDEILRKYEQIKKGILIPPAPVTANEEKPKLEAQQPAKAQETKPATPVSKDRKKRLSTPKQPELFAETPSKRGKTAPPSKPLQSEQLPSPPKAKAAEKPPGKFATYRGEITLAVLLVLILASIVFVYLKFGSKYLGKKEEPVEKITVFEARKENLEQAVLKDSLQTPLPVQQPDSVVLRITAREKTWVRMIIDEKDTSEIMFLPAMKRSFAAKQQFELKMGRADGLLFWVNQDSIGALGSAGEFVERVVIGKQGIIDKKIRRPRPISQPVN